MNTKQQANRSMLRRIEVSALAVRLEMLRDEFYRDGDRERWVFLAEEVKRLRGFLKGLQPENKGKPPII